MTDDHEGWVKFRPSSGGQFSAGVDMRDIERLADSSALDLPSAEWTWTHGFFAPWNDETAEAHVRHGIMSAVNAGRYGDLSGLYICLVLVLIRASRVREAQAALDEADRSGAWTTAAGRQEDMARILIKEYSGDLDAAREVAEGAVARSRAGGLPPEIGRAHV